MAGPTRLELATSGVTGRRSNQLNYDPVCLRAVALRRDKQVLLDRCELSPLASVHVENLCRACTAEARREAVSEGVGGTGLEPVTAGV